VTTDDRTRTPHARNTGAGDLLRAFGDGLLMGGADVIPGVSGGTVALIVGIYERLVLSIHNLAGAVTSVFRGDLATARQRWRDVEWRLLLPLGTGILLAVAVGSVVIVPLLERFPSQMRGLFFGMIAASLAVPWRRVETHDRTTWAITATAAVVAAVLVGLPPAAVHDPAPLMVFGSAAIAICAMILPGVSGAFLLLVLGIYEATLRALSGLDLAYIGVFVAGAVLGLGIFSRLLAWLLEHHHRTTMAALVGLMAGSLRALWPWQTEDRGLLGPPADAAAVLTVIAIAAAGFAAVLLLIRSGDRR